jgi:hypothetical protein
MAIEIFDCAQNSPEWFSRRLGLPTASKFHCILAKGEGKIRKSYLYQLAAEIITGEPTESFQSAAMERGKEMEQEALRNYVLIHDCEPQLVGFIRNGRMGASPDSLIGDDGVLEIKTQRADLLISTLIKDAFPSEHMAQCQGALLVSGRNWIDISVFWPGMPSFVKRAYRDAAYIINLRSEIDRFNDELDMTVEKVRAYGQ